MAKNAVMNREERAKRRKTISEYVKKKNCDVTTAAKHFKVSESTIKVACKEYKVELSKGTGKRSVIPKTFDILADLIMGKENMTEIAERYGISKQAVDSIKKRAYPSLRAARLKAEQKKFEDVDEFGIAYDLLKGDYTVSGIAEKHGISQKVVRQVKQAVIKAGLIDLFREHGRKALNVSGQSSFRIAKLLNDGLPVSEVADITATTQESIRQVQHRAKKAGLL